MEPNSGGDAESGVPPDGRVLLNTHSTEEENLASTTFESNKEKDRGEINICDNEKRDILMEEGQRHHVPTSSWKSDDGVKTLEGAEQVNNTTPKSRNEEDLPPTEKLGENPLNDCLNQEIPRSMSQQDELLKPFISKDEKGEEEETFDEEEQQVRWSINEMQQEPFPSEHFDRIAKLEKQFYQISSMSLSTRESAHASQLLDHSKDIHSLKKSVDEIDNLKNSVHEIKNKKKKSGRLSRDVYSMMFFIPREEENQRAKIHIFVYTLLVFLLQISIQTFILVDLLDYPENNVWPNPPKDVTTVVRLSQFFACVLALLFQDDVSVSLSDMQTGCKVIFKEAIDNNNGGILGVGDRLLFWLSCFAKFVTGIQSIVVSLVVILQSEELIDLFQNFAAMAFVSLIDNIGFTLADLGFFHRYLEEQAKKISSYRYDASVQLEWNIIRPMSIVNLCIMLPLLGICGHVTNLQRSGAMFCRNLTLKVSDNRNTGDLSHWGVFVFDGSRIHGRPFYVEQNCDFNTTLLYPNLCGFLAYCGRTQRWSFVLGTREAKHDFQSNCHNQYWYPKQSVPPNPIIQTHYFISGEVSSFSVLDANEWHKVDSAIQSEVKTSVESFDLSCKDCSSSEDCNGGDCNSVNRRCNCNFDAFGMMCQEPVYPCEEIHFEYGANLGTFSYVKDDVYNSNDVEREIINFVNPKFKLMRSNGNLITFNERPIYFNYQRYHHQQFRDTLIIDASSFLVDYRYWEPLVTNGPEQVLVLSYFSGGKWNFVTPLSLVGIDHQQDPALLQQGKLLPGRGSEMNFHECVRHMFHFHSKDVRMGFKLEQLREWKIITTKAAVIPTYVSSERRYTLISDFSPTWYQLENIAPTLQSGSNTVDRTHYLSCAGCTHAYSDVCRYPTKFCDEKEGICVNLAKMYPECSTTKPRFVSNGQCNNNEDLNTEECGFDGGDCIDFNKKYPNCNVENPFWIGTGLCDGGEYNVEECGYDGGDCEWYNSNFAKAYPDCTAQELYRINNEKCNNVYPYNSFECGYDGGDCLHSQYPQCVGINPDEIGDGFCHENLDKEECGYDGGDCIIIPEYPACRGDNVKTDVGNDICVKTYNNADCGWDGGDCEVFNKNMKTKYPLCQVEYPGWLGNGFCNGNADKGPYNSAVCGWDDGDCLDFNVEYPDCHVPNPWQVGNGECDSYNNKAECGWDGGDCDDPVPVGE